MNPTTPRDDTSPSKTLRLWPGVLIVGLQWLVWMVIPSFFPEAALQAALGSMLGGLAVMLWWLFFSRAVLLERLGGIALMVLVLLAIRPLLHESLATAGQGVLYFIYALPATSLALILWALLTRNWPNPKRWTALPIALVISVTIFALLRTGGITGNANSDFSWRWAPTPEEELLSKGSQFPQLQTQASKRDILWPGFRGPERNGTVTGVRIESDWKQFPPAELWRRAVGPGWSSFAVVGDLLITQEQRGEEELVTSYRLRDGQPVWSHADPARFWESNGGAGPRATPTLYEGHVYTLGATGILNRLDAATGVSIWSRDVATDVGVSTPGWGFANSPLVFENVLLIAASGKLAGYDISSGTPRWFGPVGGGYSSPHLVKLGGMTQVLFVNSDGLAGYSPSDGTRLWEHAWAGAPIVQPAKVSDSHLLFSTGGASGALGIRRVKVSYQGDGWTAIEEWTSNRLKPYFNDFVIHEGHAYGFDGSILAAIDVENGERVWKGGRYGHGQFLLLAEQDLLLVLSEQGDVALVSATPDEFQELARFPAIEGKTWNHPVLVDDVLLVRNGQEMAAFRIRAQGQD